VKERNIKNIFFLFIPLIALIGLSSFILIPSLQLPFSLIDDPYFIVKNQKMVESFRQGDLSNSVSAFFTVSPGIYDGRFAPVWWILYTFRFWAGGLSPFIHHLIHAVLLVIIVIVIYIVVFEFIRKSIPSFFAGLFFIILFPGFENWYRISTQEPGFILILLLLLLAIRKTRRTLPLVALSTLLVFSKEICVFLIPFFITWGVIDRNIQLRKNLKVVIATLVTSGSTLFLLLFLMSRLTSSWAVDKFSMSNLLPSGKMYWDMFSRLWIPQLLAFSIAPIVVPWIRRRYKDEVRHMVLFLSLSIFSFFPLLLWGFPLLRLTLVTKMGISVTVGIGIYLLIKILKEHQRPTIPFLWFTILMLMVIKSAYVNILEVYFFASDYLAREIANGKLLNYMSELPPENTILINASKDNVDAREWVIMMPMYLNSIHNRGDLKIMFIDEMVVDRTETIVADLNEFSFMPVAKLGKSVISYETEAKSVAVSLKNLIVIGIKNKSLFTDNTISTRKYIRRFFF
jgi:hypothetical protein